MSRVFVKKPIQIEAFRYGFDQEPEWCLKSPSVNHCESVTLEWLEIETLEGIMKVGHGDYVIKGIKGEIYPCKADIFEESYDEVHPNFRVKPDAVFDMTGFKTPSVLMPLTEE